MARRVTIAPEAAYAFEEARRWLTQPGAGREGAARWVALRHTRQRLKAYPYLGIMSSEIPGHRRVAASGYRLIYRIDPDTGDERTAGDIRIVALFGPGQK